MFNHQVITETTQNYLDRQSLVSNPRLEAIRDRYDMMSNITNELNQANKNDLKRHLLLSSDKISNIFTEIQLNKENIINQQIPHQSDGNISNQKRRSNESVHSISSNTHTHTQQFNFQQPNIFQANLRQPVFKQGQDVQDFIDQNNVLEQLCQNQETFLQELYEMSENIAKNNLKWKKEIIEMNSHISVMDKTLAVCVYNLK